MWQRIVRPGGAVNYVLRGDGFHVSYNAMTWATPFGALFASDDLSDETALVYGGHFDVLNGDFRAAYERLVPLGLEACRQFYHQQAAHAGSSWTTPADKETDEHDNEIYDGQATPSRR